MALLGIDFGTAHVRVVAAPERGEPRPAAVNVTPAVVSFNRGHVSAGEAVLMMAGAVPDIVIPAVKRLLGRDPTEEVVDRLAKRCGFVATPGRDGLVLGPEEGDTAVTGTMSVIDGAAAALRYGIEQVTDDKRHEAVIAVPGWFGPPQREALARAARTADVTTLRFVQDAVAAALWAAHAHRIHGRLLVMDVGAGGVSGGLVRTDGKAVELLARAGSVAFGGDDLDAQLARTAIEDQGRQAFELVRQACEALKRELTTAPSAQKKVSIGAEVVTLTVEQWELDLMLGGMSKAIDDVAKELFTAAAIERGDVDQVLALGGMCNVAGVQREIESLVDAPMEGETPRQSAVVLGALRLAMDVTGFRAMRHEIHDGEAGETPHLSSADSSTAGTNPMIHRAPVVKRKAVVTRKRPEVRRKRVDPKLARKRRSQRPPAEGSTPPEAPDEQAIAAPSEPPPEAPASEPPSTPAAARAPLVTPMSSRRRPPAAPSEPPEPAGGERAALRVSSPVPEPRISPVPGGRISSPVPEPRISSPVPEPRISPVPGGRISSPVPEPRISSSPPHARNSSSTPGARSSQPPAVVGLSPATSSDPPPAASRPAQMPPAPSQPKYPARDGMSRYPGRDQALRAPAVPQTGAMPRRQHTTQPSVRPPPMSGPISTPPGDPLAPSSDAGDASDPGRSSHPESRSEPPMTFPPQPLSPYSMAPASATPSIAPSQLPREGTLVGLKTAVEILSQPITGPVHPSQLDPISLPVLLRRVLARRNLFGTLEIKHGDRVLRVDCEGGTASLTKTEHMDLMRVFDLDTAEWRLLATREEEPMREAIPLARVALDGLRRLLREQPAQGCITALGARLGMAPRIRAERRRIPKRLGLSPRELRFIENYIDGLQTGEELGDTGPLGSSTCFQLLILLDLYDALEWIEPED